MRSQHSTNRAGFGEENWDKLLLIGEYVLCLLQHCETSLFTLNQRIITFLFSINLNPTNAIEYFMGRKLPYAI
jgi:hypothetical protein